MAHRGGRYAGPGRDLHGNGPGQVREVIFPLILFRAFAVESLQTNLV